MGYLNKTAAAAAFLNLVIAAQSTGQSARPEVLTINDPRPLAVVSETLEHRFGFISNYEDAAVSAVEDLQDTAAIVSPQAATIHPGVKRMAVRWSSVSMTVPSGHASSPASSSEMLSAAVEAHNSKHNPGVYKVASRGDTITILPDQVKDRNGVLISARTPLDAIISFPKAERTGMETLELIAAQVAGSGERIDLGMLPTNYLLQTSANVGANQDIARDVLARLLSNLQWTDGIVRSSMPQRKLAWQLLYDAGEADPVYALNLHIAQRESPNPAGIGANPDLVPIQ